MHVSTPFSVSFRRAAILLWMDNCNGVSDCLVIDLVFVLLVSAEFLGVVRVEGFHCFNIPTIV